MAKVLISLRYPRGSTRFDKDLFFVSANKRELMSQTRKPQLEMLTKGSRRALETPSARTSRERTDDNQRGH